MTALLDPTIRCTYDADEPLSWDATVMSADTGPVQIRSKRSKPRHLLSLVYQTSIDRTGAPLDLLQDFFRAQCNPFTPFYLYTSSMWHRWGGMSAGTGNGSNLLFPFPGREVDPGSDAVTVSGALKVNGLSAVNPDYMLGYENRVVYSEDFSQAGTWTVVSGATVTRTTGQGDPNGGSTSCRIQTSGGSVVGKLTQSFGTPAAGRWCYSEVWVKNQGSYTVNIVDGLGNTMAVPNTNVWIKVSAADPSLGAAHTMTFCAPAAANALDFFVWRPMAAWAVVGEFGAPPGSWSGYVPTYASAITMDATDREQIVFFTGKAPANAAAVVISCRCRRLLLGTLTDDPDGPYVSGYRQLKLSASVSGEEQ